MSRVLKLILLASILITQAFSKSPDKSEKDDTHPNCQEFTRGLSFNDTQALGVWHLLHYKTEKTNGSGDPHCVQFFSISEQERTELKQLIEKYVENLKWESLTLKMQIPCNESMKSNKKRDYYLERLGSDGSYRSLQMPSPTAKIDLAELHRYQMHLKMIEGQYLGMMDCHEKFIFLFGKNEPRDTKLEERLKTMIEAYWPEEH